jgi:hypothetical protein
VNEGEKHWMAVDSTGELPVQKVKTETAWDSSRAYEVISQLQCYWAITGLQRGRHPGQRAAEMAVTQMAVAAAAI